MFCFDYNEWFLLPIVHDYNFFFIDIVFKGALAGLKQFLATESPSKMTKNAFYITLTPSP